MKLSNFLGDMHDELTFWLLRSVPETATSVLFVAEADVITNFDDKRFFWRMTVPEITLKKYASLTNDPSAQDVPRLRSTGIPVHGSQTWAETMFIDESVSEHQENECLPYLFRFRTQSYYDHGIVRELGAARILSGIIAEQKLGPCLVQPEWYEEEAVIQVRLPSETDAIVAKGVLFERAQKLVNEVF